MGCLIHVWGEWSTTHRNHMRSCFICGASQVIDRDTDTD